MSIERFAAVSVVIPCYRCAKTIGRTFTSVASQTIKPAEIILVDDASGDETLETLQQLAQANPGWVKVLSLSANQGAANARNAGWDAASQPFIAFLDADDAWHAKKIEIQYSCMEANPDVVLSGHAHKILGEKMANLDWDVSEWRADAVSKKALLFSNRFITPSVMIRRDIPFRFAVGRRHMEDHLLWLEVACGGLSIAKLNVELAAIFKPSFGSSGLSEQLWAMELGDLGNYRHLYDQGHLKFPQWLGLSLFSLIKFARRVVLYWGFIKWSK